MRPPAAAMTRRLRTPILIALLLGGAALGAYLVLDGDRGPTRAAADCRSLPKPVADALAAGDCAPMRGALMQALATGESGAITRWTNTRSGTSGTIKVAAREMRGGAACRRVELAVTRSGETEQAAALACLKQGRWTLVE